MKLRFLTLTAHTDHGINILDETFSMLKDIITYYYPYQRGIQLINGFNCGYLTKSLLCTYVTALVSIFTFSRR